MNYTGNLSDLEMRALQMAKERAFVNDPAVEKAGEAAILRATRLESGILANLAQVAIDAMKRETERLTKLRAQQLRMQLQVEMEQAKAIPVSEWPLTLEVAKP